MMEGYIDADGLVSPRPCSPLEKYTSGNGLLYTSEYMIQLEKMGELTITDQRAWCRLMERSQVLPGLFRRGPGGGIHEDQQGPDDYFGIIAASSVLDRSIVRKIYKYGQSKVKLRDLLLAVGRPKLAFWFGFIPLRYNYNNVKPGTVSKSSWMGRFPALIAHMKYAMGERPSLFSQIVWLWSVATCAWKDPTNVDRWVMPWLMVNTSRDLTLSSVVGRLIFDIRLYKHFPDGMSQLLGGKYPGPEHPLGYLWID